MIFNNEKEKDKVKKFLNDYNWSEKTLGKFTLFFVVSAYTWIQYTIIDMLKI